MDGTRGRFRGLRATGGAGLTDGCDEARLIPQRMPWVGSVAEEREIHCETRQERKRVGEGSSLSTRSATGTITMFREGQVRQTCGRPGNH